jgi:hypothetical protein
MPWQAGTEAGADSLSACRAPLPRVHTRPGSTAVSISAGVASVSSATNRHGAHHRVCTSCPDGLLTATDAYGCRCAWALLRLEGWRVNRKRVQRLWREERLRVLVSATSQSRRGLDFVFDASPNGRPIEIERTGLAVAQGLSKRW